MNKGCFFSVIPIFKDLLLNVLNFLIPWPKMNLCVLVTKETKMNSSPLVADLILEHTLSLLFSFHFLQTSN